MQMVLMLPVHSTQDLSASRRCCVQGMCSRLQSVSCTVNGGTTDDNVALFHASEAPHPLAKKLGISREATIRLVGMLILPRIAPSIDMQSRALRRPCLR